MLPSGRVSDSDGEPTVVSAHCHSGGTLNKINWQPLLLAAIGMLATLFALGSPALGAALGVGIALVALLNDMFHS